MRKKKKLRKISKLIDEVASIAKEYVRLRESDSCGYVKCYTCDSAPVYYKGEGMHTRHFIHGKYKQTYLDEKNMEPQDCACNTYKNGNLATYAYNHIRKYGPEIIEYLELKSKKIWTPTREELAELKELYTIKLKQQEDIRSLR